MGADLVSAGEGRDAAKLLRGFLSFFEWLGETAACKIAGHVWELSGAGATCVYCKKRADTL